MVGRTETVEITERALESFRLQPGEDRARLVDSRLTGFHVIIGKRRISFVVQRRIKGESTQRTVTLGHWAPGKLRAADAGLRDRTVTVAIARGMAIENLGTMRGGADPRGERRKSDGPTLRTALEFHLAKMANGENRRGKVCSPESIRTVRGSVENHLAAYLDRPIVDLTSDVIDEIRNRIEADAERVGGSNPTNPPGRAAANRIIANVSAIWNSYDERHDLPGKCPTNRLNQRALVARDNRIPDDGFADWYARVMAMDNHVRRDLQLLALFIGVRTDGVRNIRWEDVDFDQDLIQIVKAKGDRPYTIPMSATVRKILERRQADNAKLMGSHGGDHGYAFPSLSRDGKTVQPVAEVKERRTVRDAKGRTMRDDDGNAIRERYLPGVQASRKTFNSVALEIGCPPEIRKALMCHEGAGVNVKSYGFPERWDAWAEWSDKIEAAIWSRIKGERGTKRDRRRS